MSSIPKFASAKDAAEILTGMLDRLGSGEVAVVRNPSYIYAPLELYPLPPKVLQPLQKLSGVVKDMDGTTTTTEPLCLHSLEWMVRQVTGRTDPAEWRGLDPVKDYPHIIGNSTTKHVEYLITTYQKHLRPVSCLKAYIVAAAWTLSQGRDEGRRREVVANIPALGLEDLTENPDFRAAARSKTYDVAGFDGMADRLAPRLLPKFKIAGLTDQVRAAVDIYYMRYHVILGDIADGRGARRAEEVLGSPDAHLIEPMPGVGVFLAAIKGWLGEDLALFHEMLAAHIVAKSPATSEKDLAPLRPRLRALGRYLEAHPIPVAVVTSSIAYEANIVLGEVFSILRRQVADWKIANEKKDRILPRFESPRVLYDAVITASDSSEIRLKPHRDLYSIALHTMGVSKEDFSSVIGFEDSESGVIAIRAAGVGLSVGVPFADTAGHDLSAAAYVLHGQVPEAILTRNLFLDPAVLKPFE